jgi:glycosyltransferase involved in cell wall biosynthesis
MLGLGGAFAAWAPRLFGSRVWVNTDGIEWRRAKFTWPQRAYLAAAEALSVLFASRIVADAAAIADYLRKRYPGLRQVSTVAYGANVPDEEPNGELIKEWCLTPDGYYILVSRLEPENHVLEIVEGFERTNSSLPLVVLGSIENPNEYVRTLLAHGSARVRFVGAVYDKTKLEALRFHARAYFHGHSVGGTNPSLLEAMACSNLVIAHDNPFNHEVLSDAGLFFSTRDDLATIVKDVDENRVNGNTRRRKSAEIIRSRYNWDQIADRYLELLQEPSKR